MVERWGGCALRRRNWSSPAFFVEGIMVVAAVGAVGGDVGQQSGTALVSPPLAQVGFWHRWAERV